MTSPQNIASVLAAEIATLPRGMKIASEHELMRRFGATRAGVRAALVELESRFVVRRTQGAGTYVNRPIEYRITSRSAPSLHETLAASGAQVGGALLEAGPARVPEAVGARLGLAPGSLADHIRRVAYIDGQIAATGEIWFAEGVVQDVGVTFNAFQSVTEVLRIRGYDPRRSWTYAATAFPDPDVADLLRLVRNQSVWHLQTLTRSGSTGLPLMFSRSWMRQDVLRVVIEMEDLAGASGTGG